MPVLASQLTGIAQTSAEAVVAAPVTSAPDRRIVVLDTDIAHDPDDAVMVALAARLVPESDHVVVLTADETGGRRARIARRLLDLMDRPDVTVVPGRDLGGDRFVMDHHLHHTTPQPRYDVVDTITTTCALYPGPVTWIGCGPMSNLADVLVIAPELSERIIVTQMGGWLNPLRYRNPHKSSHNFHTDTHSAGLALRLASRPRLVLSEHTGVPEMLITAESALYRQLAAPNAPAWAQLIVANFDAWFARRPGGSWMHDPLALSAAVGAPFVTFGTRRVRIAHDARLCLDVQGREMKVSSEVDYPAAMAWILDTL